MDNTKAVQLTENEVHAVIEYNARKISINNAHACTEYIERMKYLDKRLKDFNINQASENKPEISEIKSSW